MHSIDRNDGAAVAHAPPILDTGGPDPRPAAVGAADGSVDSSVDGVVDGVDLAVDGQHAVQWVAGDVDVATRDHVLELGAAAIAEPQVEELVVDLSQVTFFDASAVGALVGLQTDADAADKRLALRGVPPPVSKVLALTDLDESFGLSDGDGDAGRC